MDVQVIGQTKQVHPRKRMMQRFQKKLSPEPTETTQVDFQEQPKKVPKSKEPETLIFGSPTPDTTSTFTPTQVNGRKRKRNLNKELVSPLPKVPKLANETEVHFEEPIANCYQQFLQIREQINKRHCGMFPVKPKVPKGFKDYLMNRCTYELNDSTPTSPNIKYPQSLEPEMKASFTEQEMDRYKLEIQHLIEKENLILMVEQEVLRIHEKWAGAWVNQPQPFSVAGRI